MTSELKKNLDITAEKIHEKLECTLCEKLTVKRHKQLHTYDK